MRLRASVVALVDVKSIPYKSEGFKRSIRRLITWLDFLEQILVTFYVADVRMGNK